MTTQPQYTFTIDRNKRHQVQIDSIKANGFGQVSEGVFFTKEYEHALSILNSIMNIQQSNDDKNCGCYHDEHKSCCSRSERLGRNNIILFTGQRGSGKTSTILSFGNYLEHNEVNKKKFKCLPLIDPSYFDNNNNILKSVLSMMFKMAKCMLKCSSEKHEKPDINELWKCFDKVYNIIGDIEGHGKQDYSLETLNELGESSDLQEAMQTLVNMFIKVSPCEYNYLVLLIDDLDMNVSYAAQMLEQMRKFLMLDKLIILMAANLDQLQNEMRESYSSAFKHTLKDNNQTLSVDVEDLATRYLLKVFPASRRIHVHNAANNLVQTKLQITDSSDKDANNTKYWQYDGKKLQKVVLTLIWERTRLLFVPRSEDLLHPIIPTNLRDLSQFINFLLDMNKVECDAENGKLFKDAENYYLCQQNFEKFRNYILNNWIPENLSYEEEMLFKTIPHDVSEINKHLINAINVIGTKNKKRLMSREVDLEQIAKNAEGVNIDRDIYTMVSPNDPRFVKANKISDIFNQPSNYSYGDLLMMIDKYETYFESEEDRRFINAVKIYYTMLLFDTMFFKSTDVKYGIEDMDNVKIDTIIPIQRLLGGTVYYPNYFEIITSEYFKQKGPSFDAKRAFYHKFTFKNNMDETRDISKTVEERKKMINDIRTEQIRILFFILYYGDVRPDRYDLKHTYDTTHYRDSYIKGKRYATFDMLSLFNNALNPLQTIQRAIYNTGFLNKKDFIESYDNKYLKWKTMCRINHDDNEDDKDTRLYIPNAVLPFYSVDMMLKYLRKQYEDDEVIDQQNNDFTKDIFGRNKYDIFVLRMKEFINCIKDNKRVEDLEKVFEKSKILLEGETKKVLETHYFILDKAYQISMIKQYQVGIQNDSIEGITKLYISVSDYKNHIISLLYDKYTGTDKERNEIIKKINEFNTVPEIYNYLCTVLWADVVMELIVKRKVQEYIRKRSSICNYYNKLWDLTEQAFNEISCSISKKQTTKSDIENVYNKIYNKGVETFINPQ